MYSNNRNLNDRRFSDDRSPDNRCSTVVLRNITADIQNISGIEKVKELLNGFCLESFTDRRTFSKDVPTSQAPFRTDK